jgi:uncharacterized protein (TIRG00374 family)
MKIPRAAIQVAQILVCIGLLVILLEKIGLTNLGAVLAGVWLPYLVLPFMWEVTDALLKVHNLRRLLTARGIYLPFGGVAYSYAIGTFFGAVVPSSLGTDALRGLSLAKRYTIKLQDALIALIILNIIGLFSRCLITAGGSFLMLVGGTNIPIFAVTLAAAFVYIIVLAVCMAGRLPSQAQAKTAVGRFLWDRAHRLYLVIRSFQDQRGLLLYATVVALISQVVGILETYSVSVALNLHVSIWCFFLFVPILALSRLVPASLLGFGLEQGVFVYLFQQVGVPPAEALAMSLVQSMISLVFTLICGFLYLGASVTSLAANTDM